MDKYLGNKRTLLKKIEKSIGDHIPDFSSVCDIFAGTSNVGRYFNDKSITVFSNDINRFSYVLGSCYFGLNEYPKFNKINIPDMECDMNDFEISVKKLVKKDKETLFKNFKVKEFVRRNQKTLNVITYLNKITDYKEKPKNAYITDFYTIFGNRSGFKSVRGKQGKRNYFSKENALKIDLILETIRGWYLDKLLNANEVNVLLTSVIEQVVIIANVNGTFHDFNRDKLWPNSLQTFSLKVPLYKIGQNNLVFCNDSLKVIEAIPDHDVLYIDPPYNFRQYSAYYHFINFISAYVFLDDVEEYLSDIEFVRGQNMKDDFTSDFCSQKKFIDALRNLILKANCNYVVMSYYGGRNHWNHWKNGEIHKDEGFVEIKNLFEENEIFDWIIAEPLFEKRQNYQSRVGEKKEFIDEYLFIAKKKKINCTPNFSVDYLLSPQNKHFSLEHFIPKKPSDLNI